MNEIIDHIYLVRTNYWNFSPIKETTEACKTKESAWRIIEKAYYNFINSLTVLQNITEVKIYSSKLEIRFSDMNNPLPNIMQFVITKLPLND